MKTVFFFLILTSIFAFSSCKKVNAKKGPILDHPVTARAFNQIVLKCGGTLRYYENANDSTIVITTSQEVFDVLEIWVEDSVLTFGLKKGYSINNVDHLYLLVSAPLVKNFTLSGLGDIEVNRSTTTNLERCELTIKGAGDITVNQMNSTTLFTLISGKGDVTINNIVATNTSNVISGSGDITLYGDTYYNYLSVQGTGNFNAFSLYSTHADIDFSGHASARVRVDSTLDVNISGYGNIFYKGFPTISQNITGSGSINNAN